MLKFASFVTFSLLASSIHESSGVFHSFNKGFCPQLDSMPNFDIQKFLGEWFVVESYNEFPAHCLRENFTQVEYAKDAEELIHDEDDEIVDIERKIIDMARSISTKINEVHDEKNEPVKNEEEEKKVPAEMVKGYEVTRSYFSVGDQKMIQETGQVKFNGTNDRMEINYPLSETGMLNLRNYQVLMTDYDTYALVWRCQKTIFGHRRTAQIMSRTADLEKDTQVELQMVLRQLEMDKGMKVHKVRQTNCEKIEKEVAEEDKSSIDISGLFEKPKQSGKSGSKKKIVSIDIGGMHFSLSLPFFT